MRDGQSGVERKMTALGGALVLADDGVWRWADGTPEPRCETAMRSWFAPNLRCITYGSGRTFVELPQQWRDLYSWDHSRDIEEAIVSLRERHGLRAGVSAEWPGQENHRATRPGWLIPIEEWDRIMSVPCGVRWDREHEADILARAAQFRAQKQ